VNHKRTDLVTGLLQVNADALRLAAAVGRLTAWKRPDPDGIHYLFLLLLTGNPLRIEASENDILFKQASREIGQEYLLNKKKIMNK